MRIGRFDVVPAAMKAPTPVLNWILNSTLYLVRVVGATVANPIDPRTYYYVNGRFG